MWLKDQNKIRQSSSKKLWVVSPATSTSHTQHTFTHTHTTHSRKETANGEASTVAYLTLVFCSLNQHLVTIVAQSTMGIETCTDLFWFKPEEFWLSQRDFCIWMFLRFQFKMWGKNGMSKHATKGAQFALVLPLSLPLPLCLSFKYLAFWLLT